MFGVDMRRITRIVRSLHDRTKNSATTRVEDAFNSSHVPQGRYLSVVKLQ